MSQLSRRSLVSSAAAFPALAVPAVASTQDDPIFAANRSPKNGVGRDVSAGRGIGLEQARRSVSCDRVSPSNSAPAALFRVAAGARSL